MKMPWMMTDEEWEAQQKKESQAQQAGLAAEALAGAAEKAGPELINKALNQ
jgi:hypothetical protein